MKKYVPSTNETTIFVYDAAGKTIAEYSTITANQADAKVSYLTNDHLGSPRITTDANGKVISRRDFMPFGEEIPRANYGSDLVRQKFTGYERDGETGLDYAKARMFRSGVGRFTSPDDFLNDTVVSQPASWNLYVYVRNNPLNITDPSGEKIYAGDITDPEERAEFLRRNNATYGCSACVTIDDNGFLQVDTTGLSKEILNATAFFTEAINSTDLMFQAVVSNNDPDVEFGKSFASQGSVPRFGPDGTQITDPKTGRTVRRNATLIKLDFADDKNFVGGSDADKASFLDLVFAHEVSHFSPSFKRDPTTDGQRGVVDNPINEIRLLLGMPLRAAYLNHNLGAIKTLRFGDAVKDANRNVVRGTDGIEVDGSRIIIWINKQKP